MYDFDDSSNEEAVKEQRQKIKNEKDQLKEDYRFLVRTNEGRRFFKHFLKKGKILDISFTGNSMTFFNEGHRNFAKIIYNELCMACPEEAADILTELNLELVKGLSDD